MSEIMLSYHKSVLPNKMIQTKRRERREASLESIRTLCEVRTFFLRLDKAGVVFHPDYSFKSILKVDSGLAHYTDAEARHLDHLMEEAQETCRRCGVDIYSFSLGVVDRSNAPVAVPLIPKKKSAATAGRGTNGF